jgi:hypothetical protein
MKRAIFLATLVLVLMLVLAPVALAQSPTPTPTPEPLPEAGGPSLALPVAALLIGSGLLTYAILRRREYRRKNKGTAPSPKGAVPVKGRRSAALLRLLFLGFARGEHLTVRRGEGSRRLQPRQEGLVG